MTPHRKANHIVGHCSCTPRNFGASVRRRTPVEGTHYDNFVALANTIRRGTAPCDHGTRHRHKTHSAAQGCAGALPSRSTVMLRGGVVPTWEQFRISGASGRGRTSEQLFILGAKIFRGSVSWCGRSGLTTRSRALPGAPNAPNATPASSSKASASRTPKRCTRCTARSWKIESLAKATRGKAGTAGGAAPVRRSTAGTGLRVGAAGAALPATSELMDVTAGETALNSVDTAVTRNVRPGVKVLGKTTCRELLAPRLRRESGGVTPTAQMTQATEGKRAEVQGSAAVVTRGGRPRTQFASGREGRAR